jgi:NDP-sugar pyrophosphorylase family protein
MVLAAGLGLRMRPLTLLRAKPVLPVLNRPLLHWTLELLARHGVDDVMINLHHLPQTITGLVGDGRRFGLRVAYSRERTLLGTAGGPRQVRDYLGSAPFLLVNGDMAFEFDLSALVARHRASGARATLALKPNPDPRHYGSVVTGRDGRVRSLVGLPREAKGRVSLFTGVHVLDPALLDRLPPGRSDTVRDLYPRLVEEGERVMGVRVRGAWYDLSSPSLYLASQAALLGSGFGGIGRRKRLVHPTARVAPGARISRSVVGPGTVVAEGAWLEGSALWAGARVGRGARIRDSILADGVEIGPGERLRGQVVVDGARMGRTFGGGRRRQGRISMEMGR